MIKTISLELPQPPDHEDRLIYQMVSDMFDVVVEFEGVEIVVYGLDDNVTAWIAFHLLPMELVEA